MLRIYLALDAMLVIFGSVAFLSDSIGTPTVQAKTDPNASTVLNTVYLPFLF